MSEARVLRELELLEVARLYGLEVHEAKDGNRAEALPRESEAAVLSPAHLAPAASSLDELRKLVVECRACGLCKQRKQAVFGVGAETAEWMFVGEGPGAEEDELGDPFVGQSGRLLDSMLAAIGCKRGRETYIANVVKCRPPGNRNPTPEEASACAPFLDRQIELVAPRLLVVLGKIAATRILGGDASLASLRGRVHRYRDIPVVVTYHPAYLLRELPEKAKAWEDLLFARRTLAAA